ncbi:ABC transporter ATP-binding protein [Georgenia sp. 10Sc9-8]|uniref:ABC transporter ATP-binding protein n=1 Tax=Georgenia halotolerans TaxID=3028317 RepID=A0ABT5TXC4_9MICO|nr:ABC transporter ATP-binding protein [Georgenia halotolerans]
MSAGTAPTRTSARPTPMLEMAGVDVFYGPVQALHRLSLTVAPGEVVAVLGGNASGKSTTIKSALRSVTPSAGRMWLAGEPMEGMSTPDVVSRGVASIPESRRLFAEMTVQENVLMGLYTQRRRLSGRQVRERLAEAAEPFPRLRERWTQLAGTLSGGEQQMVAMARALVQRPTMICIDEPSMGLSPAFVDTVYEVLTAWKAAGTTMLVVEQNAHRSLELADRAYILQNGEVVLAGTAADLRGDAAVQRAYLGGAA